jgi:hypothetical protein
MQPEFAMRTNLRWQEVWLHGRILSSATFRKIALSTTRPFMMSRMEKTISAIQDRAALTFQEFHDFLRLVSLDTHFLKRRAKVLEESIEVSVVQALLPRLRMGGGNIFACIYDTPPKEHGDKHTLPCEQVRHITTPEEVADAVIGQDSSIEGFGGHPDCFFPADEVIQVVDHLILLNAENGRSRFKNLELARNAMIANLAGWRHHKSTTVNGQ